VAVGETADGLTRHTAARKKGARWGFLGGRQRGCYKAVGMGGRGDAVLYAALGMQNRGAATAPPHGYSTL